MEKGARYILKRIEKVLKRETACLQLELHRRLGEVGQPRLDPRLVDYFLEIHLATPKPKIVSVQRDALHFYGLPDAPEADLERVIEEKSTLYKRATRLKDSRSNVDSVHRMFLEAARQACVHQPRAHLRLRLPTTPHPPGFALRGACMKQGIPFEVFVSNDLGWIHPHSPTIWVPLSHCCAGETAIPVIIGRFFHPSCFSLFKTLGILGHQTYKVYSSPKVWPDSDRLKTTLGFPTASSDSLNDRHVSLFANTLPTQIQAAFTNFDQLSSTVARFALEEALADANLDPDLRLERFISFLNRLPPTKLVKRLREDAGGAWKSL